MENPIKWFIDTLDGRRRQVSHEPRKYSTRAGRHENLDTVKLKKNRAKAKAGRKQRLANQRRGK